MADDGCKCDEQELKYSGSFFYELKKGQWRERERKKDGSYCSKWLISEFHFHVGCVEKHPIKYTECSLWDEWIQFNSMKPQIHFATFK